jgi:hypothetical protein
VPKSSHHRHLTGAATTVRVAGLVPTTVNPIRPQKASMGVARDAPPPTAPLGLVADSSVLPNSPYSNPRGALVHSWRQDRWFSWIFGVGNSAASDTANASRYLFDQGGHQGSRGGKRGQEFFIENVYEELDAPGI